MGTACAPGADSAPYFQFVGGGFIMNYRSAEAEYGFVARRVRRVPDGTVLEARLEDPAGGAPFVFRESVTWNRPEYVFRSPPVHGVVAGVDYRVEIRLIHSATGRILATYTRTFRSELDQSALPNGPTVIGPGHRAVER